MKNIAIFFTFVLMLLLAACGRTENFDNVELQQMVEADQKDRSEDNDEPLEPKDELRRKRVFEMLADNEIKTAKDKINAAVILQHTGMVFADGKMKSKSVENHYLAYQLAKSAFESGYEKAGYFTAVTYDRYAWMSFGYQKYGTQSTFINGEQVWVTIDAETSDEEREKFGVPALSELLKSMPMQN